MPQLERSQPVVAPSRGSATWVRSHRTGRELGLTFGVLLLAFGAWRWRVDERGAASAAAAVGLGLVGLGLLVPRVLVPVHRLWSALGERLGAVVATVLLAVVFFFVVTPIGLLRRWRGSDPLRRREPTQASWWVPAPARRVDPRHYEKMF